jgi:peptide/nickel transport system substrate-binding protein
LPEAFAQVDVRAPDDGTVIARYEQPDADLLDAWTFPLIPEHLSAGDDDLLQGEFASSPVGCGPFRFVRYVRGSEIVLEAVPDHWAGRPGIDQLIFKIVRDDRTALQALLTGELDIVVLPPELYREALDSDVAATLTSTVYSRLSVWWLAYNVRSPKLSDARVRRALVHLLDRETFIREMLDGLGVPGVTTWHPDSPWADPDLEPLSYDPDLAAKLLEEAGWRDRDGDGLRDRDGRPFRLEFLYNRGSQAILDQFAAWYQQSLGDAGIDVRLEAMEVQTMRQRRNEGDFDVVMGSFSFDPTGDQSVLYHSQSIENGFNFFGWQDAETDALLEEARSTFDESARRALYARLQHRLRDQVPLVALFHPQVPLLHRRELHGVRPTPLGLYRTVPGPAAWRWDPSGSSGR